MIYRRPSTPTSTSFRPTRDSSRQSPPSRQLKVINANSYMLIFTIWYNWYSYYARKIVANLDYYKIIIGLSVITTLVAFFLSISVFLQAIYNHFNANIHLRNDFHSRIQEESLNMKLIRGNVSEWIPSDSASMLYTAYYDPRLEVVKLHSYSSMRLKKPQFNVFGTIRIFGIFPRSWNGIHLMCHLKYPNGKERVVESTAVHSIKWNKDFEYLSFYVLCDVEYNHYGQYILPQYVGLKDPYTNELIGGYYLPIIYPKRINAYHYPELDISNLEFAICIGPKNSITELGIQHLNEFFEYYQKFGANKIFIYGHDFKNEMILTPVIKRWIYKNLVVTVDWNLQGYSSKDLYHKGNVAAWNDCLYRTSIYLGFKYVAILDVNEYIYVNFDKKSIGTLMDRLNKKFEQHPIYWISLEDYYVRHNDHMDFLTTEHYCLANEVQPFDYIPNRYIVRGLETASITDNEIESIDLTSSEPQVDIPPKIAVLKRYQKCHTRMAHCQCNFNWPRLNRERLKKLRFYQHKIPPMPKNHSDYKFKGEHINYKKMKDIPGIDDDFN